MRAVLASTTCPVEPGASATCTLTITNLGTVVDEFTVQVLGAAAEWAEANPPALSLFPQAAGTITLVFSPPRKASVHAGPLPFGVLVQSRMNPEERETVEGALLIGAYNDVVSRLVPKTSKGRLKGRHRLRLRNAGNTPVTAAISATDPDELLRLSVRPSKLTLAPGERAEAKLTARPRAAHFKGPAERRPFEVVVSGAGQPVKVDGLMLQRPFVATWQIAAFAVAAALVVALLLVRNASTTQLKSTAEIGAPATASASGAAAQAGGAAAGSSTGSSSSAATGGGGGASGGSGSAAASSGGAAAPGGQAPQPLSTSAPASLQHTTTSSSAHTTAATTTTAASTTSTFSQGFTALPGSAIAVASWGSGRLDGFTRGTDNSVWHVWYQGGGWGGWENLQRQITSDPAAVSWGSCRIDVFVRGEDNHLWQDYYPSCSQSWSGWVQLDGGVTLTSNPTVASWASGRLDIFWRGTDNGLWHKWYDGAWHAAEDLGGSLVSSPAATSWGPGRIDVVAVLSDGRLYDKVYDGAWHPFALIGTNQAVAGDPGLSSQGSGSLDLFVTNPGGGAPIHLAYSNGAWGSWDTGIGGIFTSGPRNVSWSGGRIDMFGRGTNGDVYHRAWQGGWFGWGDCGKPGTTSGTPAC